MVEAESSALWSSLYDLYMAIALLVGALVLGWLFYSLWRFRARPGALRPADAAIAGAIAPERGHPLWSYVMAALIAVIMFGLAFGTISAVETMENPPEGVERVHVDVIGYQFGWKYNYTGAGGVPFQITTPTTDESSIPRFPMGVPVVMNVTSQDVWHNFAIPGFRLRIDAVPGQVNHLWFRAVETGEERHVCVQLCGLNHAKMHTMTRVVDRAEFDAWLAQRSDAAYARLATQIARDAKAGAWINGTVDASGLALDATSFVKGKPIVLNLTSGDGAAHVVTVGDRTLDVPAAGFARLYLPPAGQAVEVRAGNDVETLTEASA